MDDSELTELLARITRGDERAMHALHEALAARLIQAAFSFTGDAELARDATQECLIAVFQDSAKCTKAESARAWIFALLFNQCRKMMRSNARRRRRETRSLVERRQAEHRALALHDEAEIEQVREALAKLDEGLRATVILRFLEGLSVEQCAQVLGVPPGTIKSRTHSALRKLQGLLQAEHVESSRTIGNDERNGGSHE